MKTAYAISERPACAASGFGRASHRYVSRRDPSVELRHRLKELADRYGYRRLQILLQREGWRANHKKIYRLYSEEGLSMRTKTHRRRRACRYRGGRSPAEGMNDVWAMDFMSDRLFDGQAFRILTVVDCHTREALSTAGHVTMKPVEAENERLRREVQKLKAERDILKKAAAYFAKDHT